MIISGIQKQFHYQKAKSSGLSDEMIERWGLYTETNRYEIRKVLSITKGDFPAPAAILPCWGADGKRDDSKCMVRFKEPYVPPGKAKGRKYQVPRYTFPAFFPPHEVMWEALRDGYVMGITEGWFKAARLTQAGFPCIGLTSMSTWSLKDTLSTGEAEFISDLAELPWAKWIVPIIIDYDPCHKPMVEYGAMRLAEHLARLGSNPVVLKVPTTLSGKKQGVDDFIVKHGEDVVLDEWLYPSILDIEGRRLQEYRHEMAKLRTSASHGIISLDTSPTGSGKSWIDANMISTLAEQDHERADQPRDAKVKPDRRAHSRELCRNRSGV